MAAVQLGAREMLLTLTEDGVNLLTLPDMKLKFQPMGSRGATLFAWSEADQLLAVVVRRRVSGAGAGGPLRLRLRDGEGGWSKAQGGGAAAGRSAG